MELFNTSDDKKKTFKKHLLCSFSIRPPGGSVAVSAS